MLRLKQADFEELLQESLDTISGAMQSNAALKNNRYFIH